MLANIQMTIFVAGILIIVFIAVRSQKKDMVDISNKELHFLQQGAKYPIGEEMARGIKKRRWIWTVFAVGIVYFISDWMSGILMNIGNKRNPDMTLEMYEDLWRKQSYIQYGIFLVGILLIAGWLIYDVIQTKKPENKYKVPAYVQSTFTNPKHRTRSARLMYYDYKQLKCRLRTISITRLERAMGTWGKGDMVYIIVEEGANRIRFVTVLEERVAQN